MDSSDNSTSENSNLIKRLHWLMFCRVLIVTFMLGIAAFIQFKTKSLPEKSLNLIYCIIVIHYFLFFVYLILLKKFKNLTFNLYPQIIIDIALITWLVYVTGGVGSPYSIFYPLVIIYAALFLAKKGGILSSSCAAIFYGLLLDLEYHRIIHPIYDASWDYNLSAGYAVPKILTSILSFYIIAFLISFAVEKEKNTRYLLAEKSSEFDKLDLLHKSIIESLDVGIMTIDLKGIIKSFNRAAELMTGFKSSEVYNKALKNIFPDFHKILDKMTWYGRNDIRTRFESLNFKKGFKEMILDFSVSSLIDTKENRIGKVLIFKDITAIAKAEKQAEKSKKLAFIGEMAAGLAHDVRNPLASLSGSIQMLRKNLKLNKTNEKLMQIILRGRDQLENLVKGFLLLARQESDKNDELNLSDIIKEILESIYYGNDYKHNIKINYEFDEMCITSGNKTEIREAICNLISNAIDSMHDKGLLTIKIRSILIDGVPYIEITIADTGCGIDENVLNKIFEPFYTTKESGTGLGLAIVNRIAESHGGKISIESIPGKGTCCRLLLP
ncbi:two-component system, NtrC family, sensor histidine kinase PilS [Candidatus Magnetomoraceae bacterium gMMP-1]